MYNCISGSELFCLLLEFLPNFGGCVFTFGWLVTLNVSWMRVCLCVLSRICSWLDLPNRLWPLLGISSSKKKIMHVYVFNIPLIRLGLLHALFPFPARWGPAGTWTSKSSIPILLSFRRLVDVLTVRKKTDVFSFSPPPSFPSTFRAFAGGEVRQNERMWDRAPEGSVYVCVRVCKCVCILNTSVCDVYLHGKWSYFPVLSCQCIHSRYNSSLCDSGPKDRRHVPSLSNPLMLFHTRTSMFTRLSSTRPRRPDIRSDSFD